MGARQNLLSAVWPDLPPVLRAFHNPEIKREWRGRGQVTRGSNFLARLICFLFRFPPAGSHNVVIVMEPTRRGERWTRRFGAHHFSSNLRLQGVDIREDFFPFSFALAPTFENGRLNLVLAGMWLGPLPVPRLIWPRSTACEFVDAQGRTCFDIAVELPLIGPLVNYRGQLTVPTN